MGNTQEQKQLLPKVKANSDAVKIIQELVDIALKNGGLNNLGYAGILANIDVDNDYFLNLEKKAELQRKEAQEKEKKEKEKVVEPKIDTKK